MVSKFTERIYCICGNLDDMICEKNLRKMTFNQYFGEYLKKYENFDYVVFYLASRGMRVFDDRSAMELIGGNRDLKAEPEEVRNGEGEADKAWRYNYTEEENEAGIYEISEDEDDDFLEFDKPIPGTGTGEYTGRARDTGITGKTDAGISEQTDTDTSGRRDTGRRMSYSERREAADFAGLMDQLLRDPGKKTAIVFESLMDYVQLSSDDRSQFEATFQYFLSDSLDDNQNKVFFLAMNMDRNQIYAQIGNNDWLGGVFFQEQTGNPTVRREKFIEIGKPGKDEIRNLLEHYRLYGYQKKYLSYPMNCLNDFAYLLEAYAEKAKGTSLNEINRVLQETLDSYEGDHLVLSREVLKKMYPRVRDVELPLERFSALPYTENVVMRLRAIRKYRQMEEEEQSVEIDRFMKAESRVSSYGCRFLLKGIEESNRTKTAIALADFLYYIGEVSSKRHVIVRRDDISRWTAGEMEKVTAQLIREAENAVLILDDLDALTEMEDSKKLIRSFHRCLQEELSRDRGIHLIMVVNTSKANAVFGESDMEKYEIPEKNILELSREAVEETEETYVNRGKVSVER